MTQTKTMERDKAMTTTKSLSDLTSYIRFNEKLRKFIDANENGIDSLAFDIEQRFLKDVLNNDECYDLVYWFYYGTDLNTRGPRNTARMCI